MNKYWLRYKELIIGNKKWIQNHKGGLEIQFSIKKTSNDNGNKGNISLSEVVIYNLSQDSINSINKDDLVILNVGYEGNVGNILHGNIIDTDITREGLSNKMTITVADGGKEWRDAKFTETYGSGIKASYIMRELANIMGYEVAKIEPKNDIVYKLGKSITGHCGTNLKQLVKDTDSKLYIENNRLFIMGKYEGIENGFLINSDTGLLESPQVNKEDRDGKEYITYDISTKFNHELTINSHIQVQSKTINGTYRIVELEHTSDFITNIKVVEN